MSDRKVVIFEVEDVDAEERLIREYVGPAFRRLEDHDEVRWLMFNRYGNDPSVTGGEVTFYIFGDVETVAADERDRWNALVAEGLADGWWTDDAEVRIDDFDEAERLRHRLRATASRMSVVFYEEFDELPDAVDELGADGKFGVGWWACLHHLINQLGYQRKDGEEEIDLLFEDLRNRLYFLATGDSVNRANTKVEELVTELEGMPPKLADFRERAGEHEHQYTDKKSSRE